MNRYRTYGPHDDVPEMKGDNAFMRLDLTADPATLPPGVVQQSQNMRFDQNGARVRGGLARQWPAGSGVGPILLTAVYQPVGGTDLLAHVCATALVLFDPTDQSFTTYAYPAGVTVNPANPVDFIQGGLNSGTTAEAWILNGIGVTALKFNGTAMALDAKFTPGDFGLFVQNRMVVNDSAQSVSVSNFLDFTVWDVLSQFQVEWGGNDFLVGIIPWQNDIQIIGARKRMLVAFFDPETGSLGYSGGLKANTSFLRVLTRETGIVGKRAMCEAFGKIWCVSDNKIYAFTPNLQLELTALPKPISADIEPLMKRMSAEYAQDAVVVPHGYRLYFALPISDEPVNITDIEVSTSTGIGLTLPFTLPALLSAGGIATVTTATPHNLSTGDQVFIAGVTDQNLNGEFTVLNALDLLNFQVQTNATAESLQPSSATAQKLATRNNTILVFNLENKDEEHPYGMWESVDTLPGGFFADGLLEAHYGAKQRLWVVDADFGPAVYEQNDADDVGTVVGGVQLPFTLPVTLNQANYATSPIPGLLTGRAIGFGQFIAEVRAGRSRLTLAPGDAGQITVTVESPNRDPWVGVNSFAYGTRSDVYARKRSGKRGLNGFVSVQTTGGRPTIRTLELETTALGTVAE